MSACILLIGIKYIARQRYKKWIGKRKCFFAGKASLFERFQQPFLQKVTTSEPKALQKVTILWLKILQKVTVITYKQANISKLAKKQRNKPQKWHLCKGQPKAISANDCPSFELHYRLKVLTVN